MVFKSVNPRSISGVDHLSADLHDYKSLLKDIYAINQSQSRAILLGLVYGK